MADWTAPFTLPKYTTEEFRQLKADYVAKHGYTITFPGLFDIIKIPLEIPMTELEQVNWKAKRLDQFSDERIEEIRYWKQKRKDKFLAMLASPTPEVVTNAGALMTAIDNAQDALYTLGGIGVVAMRFSPPPVAAALSLPTGAVLTAASALTIIGSIGKQKLPGIEAKRQWQKKTNIDPWSKKGRIKYAKHLIKTYSVKAGVLQALQTTESVFGIGLSLGPIVGLFTDIISGPVRRLFGDKVTVDVPIPSYDDLTVLAQYVLRAHSNYFYPKLRTSDEEVITMIMAQWLAQATLYSGTLDVPGWQNFNNLDQLELKAPRPRNILTLEVIAEQGLNVDDLCGWLHNSKPWALATDIVNEYSTPAQDFFNDYMRLHDTDWLGYIFKTLACDATMYTLSNASDDHQIVEGYTAQSRACSILLENRLYPDPDQPSAKTQLLADHIDALEATAAAPTLRDLLQFCEDNQITLTPF